MILLRVVVSILISCSVAMAGQGMGPGPGVKGYTVGGGPLINEDFSGTLSNWTVESGTGTWAISSGQLEITNTSGAEYHARHNTTTSSVNQFAKMTMVSRATTAELAFLLRCDSSVNCDEISFSTSGDVSWAGITAGNWATGYATVSHSVADGSVLRCYITGTGASTRIYCYDDGVLIDGGSGYTFGGADGKDTGNYVAVYGTGFGTGSIKIDDFKAGDGADE